MLASKWPPSAAVWVVQSSRGDRLRFASTDWAFEPPRSPSRWRPRGWAANGEGTLVTWTSAMGLPASPIRAPSTTPWARDARRSEQGQGAAAHGARRPSDRRPAGGGAARIGSAPWPGSRAGMTAAAASHSEIRAADVGANPGVRTLAGSTAPASGVDIAADAAGDQGISWNSWPAQRQLHRISAAVRGAKSTFGAYTSSFGSG